MKKHTLKCWPQFFAEVLNGSKPFEIRYNDRGYEVGDMLRLEEYLPGELDIYCQFHGCGISFKRSGEAPECTCGSGTFTGRVVERIITCVCSYAQRSNIVVLGLAAVTLSHPTECEDSRFIEWLARHDVIIGSEYDSGDYTVHVQWGNVNDRVLKLAGRGKTMRQALQQAVNSPLFK
jgi:hypothetical protein